MQQRLREARQNRDGGFTLIELLIVIVVLGILATIVVFGVAQFQDDAEEAACTADLKTVQVAADAALAQAGNYPAGMAALVSSGYLKTAPAGVPVNAQGVPTSNGPFIFPGDAGGEPETVLRNC